MPLFEDEDRNGGERNGEESNGIRSSLIVEDEKTRNGYHNGITMNQINGTSIKKEKVHPKLNGTINGKIHFDTKEAIEPNQRKLQEEYEETPFVIAILCYLSYIILNFFGHLRDFLRHTGLEKNKCATERNRSGYTQLYSDYEGFYTRNIYRRICHGWNQPICSLPGPYIDILDRETDDYNWTFRFTGTTSKCINMGSYNYLGFAENEGPRAEKVRDSILKYGASTGTTRHEYGTLEIHHELENLLAKFLKVEDAVVFGMGFATNSTNIPTLAGKGCLLMSDELNHASLILGCRLSGASVKVFKHNNISDLEAKLRQAIVEGQPKTHRPWKKIIIVVEGVYSMEGSIVNLPEIIRLKKKYKTYLYLDEAHSIGALGESGRGVCDYFGIDTRDVDLLMGTFTKSFGSAGGYIAGSKQLVNHIRINSHSFGYASSMAAPIAQQIISVLRTLMGMEGDGEGRRKIMQLAKNSRYFRQKLKQQGFIVYGNDDSPVVPLLIYFPGKIVAFVKGAKELGVATVGAGYPATPLIESRVRFCLSACHTKEMLDKALEVTSIIGDRLALKYSRRSRDNRNIEY